MGPLKKDCGWSAPGLLSVIFWITGTQFPDYMDKSSDSLNVCLYIANRRDFEVSYLIDSLMRAMQNRLFSLYSVPSPPVTPSIRLCGRPGGLFHQAAAHPWAA
jgi:hypothetical protein